MKITTQFPSCVLVGAFLSCFGLCVVSSSAQAGFQWVAPADASAQTAPAVTMPSQTNTMMQQAPATPPTIRSQAIISPVIIDGGARVEQPANILPNHPANDYGYAPAENGATNRSGNIPPNQPLNSLPNYAAMPAVDAGSSDKPVRGFAKNVPLAVALRQILPPEYGYTLGRDVDATTTVSWRGGQSWHQTAQDMLQTAGLSMHEQGQRLIIERASPIEVPMQQQPAVPALSTPYAMAQPVPMAAPVAAPDQTLRVPSGGDYADSMRTPMAMQQQTQQQSNAPVVDSWDAVQGDTLRKTLENWCHKANIELSWQAEYDYPLQASVSLSGTFEEAVRNLLSGFQEAKPQPFAELHNHQSQTQPILVVQARGNNYSD